MNAFYRAVYTGVRGQNHHSARGIRLLHSPHNSVPVSFAFDIQIAQQQVEFLNLDLLNSFGNRSSNRDGKTVSPQNHRQGGADGSFIIDEQKALSSKIHRLRHWNMFLLSHSGTVTLDNLANNL